MIDEALRVRCTAVTRAGQPCKNYSLPNSNLCSIHQGAAPVESVAAGTGADAPNGDLQDELTRQIDGLIERVQRMTPGYTPPAFSPRRLVSLIEENLDRLGPQVGLGLLRRLRATAGGDLFDMQTWKGIWFVLNYTLSHQTDVLKRRLTGEFETDSWGFDQEFFDAVLPFFTFLYKVYWRVSTSGVDNVPRAGRALLVVNHSGQLPWDGTMVGSAIYHEHPTQRLVRTLYASWFPTLPFLSAMLVKLGQATATVENGTRLLEQDELVAVYPEGYKGVGKLFKERYRLARFGRGGFVRMALKTGAPMIPVSVVGAEETYISLTKSQLMARVTGFPYFPISPTFPWLGLLGFVPLPTKWYIDFGEPIPTAGYPAGSDENLMLVSELTDQVRNVVQEMVYKRLAERRSVFLG